MKYLQIMLLGLIIACTSTKKEENKQEEAAQVLNIYSHRHYDADKQAFENFTTQTGIKINLVKAGADELINRLEMEGQN